MWRYCLFLALLVFYTQVLVWGARGRLEEAFDRALFDGAGSGLVFGAASSGGDGALAAARRALAPRELTRARLVELLTGLALLLARY